MPYCVNCGTQTADSTSACPNCGHVPSQTVPAAPSTPPPPSGSPGTTFRRTEGTAVASLILGIVGLFVCPPVAGVLAIVFGNQAHQKIRDDPTLEGEGLARAGVILGWVNIGLTVLGVAILLLSLGSLTWVR